MSIQALLRHALPAVALCAALSPGLAQSQDLNLANCEGLWFSTSEDFLSRSDQQGGPIISDGDLLTYRNGNARVCARNAELLRVFDIEVYDHGLDALDKIVIDEKLVIAAFSTELDSVNSAAQFTAGDLLFTNGAIVPNAALLAKFDLPRDFNLGLDAVHIEGAPRELRELLAALREVGPERLKQEPGTLIEILDRTNTDILFSTEGTAPLVQKPLFLDGDLLSAKFGTIVRSNADLLPLLPAGLPDRGVDYGLDAYTPAIDPIEIVPIEIFSTEINLRKGTISDGDALLPGPSIYLRNESLTKSFEPLDIDMGLDALADRPRDIGQMNCDFGITEISHVDVATRINPATGLFDGDRPFGRDIRVVGNVPGTGCPRFLTHEFQVRYSLDGGATEIPVLHPASDNWLSIVAACPGLDVPRTTDPTGWFSLTQYQRFDDCPLDPSLAIWRSATVLNGQVGDAIVWVVLRPIGGGVEETSVPVRIRIDNKRPDMLTMALYEPGSAEPFGNQCKIEGDGQPVVIDIRGTFNDDHFERYSLAWSADGNIGGAVPSTGLGRTYNSRPELTDMGTNPTPPDTDVLLENFDLSAAFAAHPQGGVLIECGYSIRLDVFDRTRLGGWNEEENIFSVDDSGNRISYLQSFCLIP